MVIYTQYYYQLEISGTNLHKKAEQKKQIDVFLRFFCNFIVFFMKKVTNRVFFQIFFVAKLKFLQKEERGKAPCGARGIWKVN